MWKKVNEWDKKVCNILIRFVVFYEVFIISWLIFFEFFVCLVLLGVFNCLFVFVWIL